MKNIQFNKKTGEILGEVAWNRSQDDDVIQVEDALWDSLENPRIDVVNRIAIEGPPIPAPVVPVPTFVSRRQMLIALHRAGLYEAYQTAIGAADFETQISCNTASVIDRDNPIVLAFAQGAGLASSQVDEIFILAGSIQ